MIEITSITDLELLREAVDLECKLAAGRDGKGALPEDFWPTYSSFANTEGGMVLLGVKEKQGHFSIEGVADIPKVRKELFDGLNNLPGEAIPTPEDVFGPPVRISLPSSPLLAASSPLLTPSSSLLTPTRNADGCLLSPQLAKPVIDDFSQFSPVLRSKLELAAAEPRSKGKIERAALFKVITTVCRGRFITLPCLAELLRRKPKHLRDQYLTRLVKERKLAMAFPKTPTHERQAYTTVIPSEP